MTHPDLQLIEALRGALRGAANPEKSGPMQSYMKSALPFYGVQKPERVRATKALIRRSSFPSAEAWQSTVLHLFQGATHREEWYTALEILEAGQLKGWLNMEALPLCETIIVEGAWWDIIDDMATKKIGTILMLERDQMTPVLREWATCDNRWKRRTSVIAQLKHKRETDESLLAFTIEKNLADPDFFLRKAIGWALRQYAKTSPDWVEEFVASHIGEISKLSYREALRILWKEGRALDIVRQ